MTKKISGVVPTKIVKLVQKEICKDLANCFNKFIKKNEFQNELKAADITPLFKKEDLLNKINYRPVSVLPTISKIFERLLFDQLKNVQISFFLPFCVVIEKGISICEYSICTRKLTSKMEKSLEESNRIVATLLMDLSNAYDCINHELIIAKLAAYELNEGSLRLIQNYLSKRKKRVKKGFSLSEWLEIIIGVPQGSY